LNRKGFIQKLLIGLTGKVGSFEVKNNFLNKSGEVIYFIKLQKNQKLQLSAET